MSASFPRLPAPPTGGLLVVFAWLAAAAPVAAAPHPDLAAYRAFARSPAAARLCATARAAMRAHWDPAATDTTTIAWPAAPTGLYLSLVRGTTTRACVGGAAVPGGDLAAAARALARQALSADTRRAPLRRDELDGMTLVIAFAFPAEPVADPMTVDPGREGLLVTGADGARIAFVPGEARTVAWALREARRAGVLRGAAADAAYERFEAVLIRDPQPGGVR